MDRVSAEDIGKKARALKHCIKVLGTIEKKGSAEIVLNCTGVKLVAHKNDALHLKIATTKAQNIITKKKDMVAANHVSSKITALPYPCILHRIF